MNEVMTMNDDDDDADGPDRRKSGVTRQVDNG